MAIASSDVSSGDDVLASQYNNLRADLLTGNVTIAGIKTFSSVPVFSAGITLSDDSSIASTKKIFFDGYGDTYIYESESNTLVIAVGGSPGFTIFAGNDCALEATGKLFFDGGSDSYMYESAGNSLRIVAGNAVGFSIFAGNDCALEATGKLFLDGGNDTYLYESSANVIDFYTGGTLGLRINSLRDSYIQNDCYVLNDLFVDGTITFGIPANNLWNIGGGAIFSWKQMPGSTTRMYLDADDGDLHIDGSYLTFTPDIKKDKKINNPTDQDYLEWALKDAKKPLKPYKGLQSSNIEKQLYGKDISKIALGLAYWAEKAEERIKILEGV